MRPGSLLTRPVKKILCFIRIAARQDKDIPAGNPLSANEQVVFPCEVKSNTVALNVTIQYWQQRWYFHHFQFENDIEVSFFGECAVVAG